MMIRVGCASDTPGKMNVICFQLWLSHHRQKLFSRPNVKRFCKYVKHIKYVIMNTSYVVGAIVKMATPKETKESVKRTTIILDDEERKYVDSLIKEGLEPGIKPLISKMLDIYRSMSIYDWRYPGEYYVGVSRVAFVNVEFINTLFQYIPQNKWREVGHRMGEAARISMEATLNLETANREKWDDVFKRLRVQGFGDFYIKDRYFVVRAPFINSAEALCGFLEKLLDIKLEVRTSAAPFVFAVVEEAKAKEGK